MRIGLYFGSFNPIHLGHLIIANHVKENTDLDNIWFVVSPQNPLKKSNTLLNEYDRLHLVSLAIAGNEHFRASNIEFSLPKPSYTVQTLAYLSERFPQHEFTIIMGSDSFQNIKNWKNYETILAHYKIIVYNRPGHIVTPDSLPGQIEVLAAPLLEISATHIRQNIQQKKSIKYLVPETVEEYILEHHLYENM